MSSQFVDGVRDIFVLGGVVRIEFFKLDPKPQQQGQAGGGGQQRPDLEMKQALSIAIPMEGFMKAVESLEKVRDGMNTPQASGPSGSTPTSPNFRMDS